jgi:hypothetical protein
MSHFGGGVPAGIPEGLAAETILLPADQIAHVRTKGAQSIAWGLVAEATAR